MALTDAQWAAEVADIIADLVAETITQAQASARLKTATEDWPTRSMSNADLAARLTRFMARLNGLIAMAGPPDEDVGEINAYYFDTTSGDFYGPKLASGWGDSSFSLVGPAGPSVDLQVDGGYIQWRTQGSEDAWINLIPITDLKGADAAQVEIQATGTHIQWRRVGDPAWIDLIAIADLKGDTGLTPVITMTAETGLPGTEVQVVKTGTNEAPNYALTIPRGAVGITPNVTAEIVMIAHGEQAVVTRSGPDSAPVLTFQVPTPLDGTDGREVEFNVTETYIQIRYVGEVAWTDLIPLALLQGAKGDRGDAFTIGATGSSLAERDAYDAEDDGFSFLDTSTGLLYFRQGVTAGVWSAGIPFGAAQSDILDALAALDATQGILVQTGANTFAKQAIGVATGASVPDRDSADTRYRRLTEAVPMADVFGLALALEGKADAAAVLAALAQKADAQETLDALELKATTASLNALILRVVELEAITPVLSVNGAVPDGAGNVVVSVPAPATVAEVWAATAGDKPVIPSVLNAAMIPTALAIAGGVVSPDCHAGINFDIPTINTNITIANLANKAGKLGRSGSITGKNDATAGRTVSLGTDWKKIGTTAFPTTANARWKIVYNVDSNGVNYSVMVLVP